MKIYTKTGDKGDTSLAEGQRVAKDCSRIEAIGMLDELNAHIGLARSFFLENEKHLFASKEIDQELTQVQNILFFIGANVAGSHKESVSQELYSSLIEKTKKLENNIDDYSQKTPALTHFILPGGKSSLLSQLHVVRTVCRRAERALITLRKEEFVREELLIYMNRLSDWFFALIRFIAHQTKNEETIWSSKNL